MKDINAKGTIIKLLNKLGEDVSNLTVGEMKDLFSKEFDEYEANIVKADNEVIDKYDKSYLVRTLTNRHMETFKELLEIKSIKAESYTTDWERTYNIDFKKIIFNKDGSIMLIEMKQTKVVEDLETYKFIAKEEFDIYLSRYNHLMSEINKIIEL